MSSVSEDRIRLNPEMMELSEALDKIANGILWQSKPKWEMRVWADMTILTLSPEVQRLVAWTIRRATNDPNSEVTGWGWTGKQIEEIRMAIKPYLPKE